MPAHPARGLAAAATATIALVAATDPSPAQQLPSQINLIVAFAAGGSADATARVVGNKLGDKLGSKIVIENRGGSGGNLAARAVLGAAPDGGTLLVTTAALPINETLMKNKGFSVDALRAISIVAMTPETLAVNKANPAKSLPEFIAQSKGKKITYSSAGVGTGSHIFAEYFFKHIAKIDAAHVPFKGGSEALAALVGGHVDAMQASLSGIASQINSGDMRGIAIATKERFPAVPQVPTFAEGGYPGLVYSSWAGFFAPAKTSDAIIGRLNKAILDVLEDKDVDAVLRKIGFAPMKLEAKASEEFFKSEVAQWGRMVTELGISVE